MATPVKGGFAVHDSLACLYLASFGLAKILDLGCWVLGIGHWAVWMHYRLIELPTLRENCPMSEGQVVSHKRASVHDPISM